MEESSKQGKSAFQPYSTPLQVNLKREKTSPPSTSEQTKAYDYSVDKILRKTSSEDATPSSTSELTNWASLPLEAIARQLWIDSHKLNPLLQAQIINSQTSSSTMCSTDLRRFLLPSYPLGHPVPRPHRGPRRQRTTFTHEQTLRLEMEYHVSEYISRSKRFQLAEILDLTENQIKIWFQNRRAKDKRIEKAIAEQQFRFLGPSSSPTSTITQSLSDNCTTCSYTKHHFHVQQQNHDSPPQ